MHATTASALSLVVLLASVLPALTAPTLPNTNKRAAGAIIGGLAKGALTGALETGFDDVKDDLGLRRRVVNPQVQEGLYGHVGSRDTDPNLVVGNSKRSDFEHRAVGAILGGLARGGAEGAVESIFDKNQRRAVNPILGQLRETVPVFDEPFSRRTVGAILGGLVRGGAEGAVESIFDNNDNRRRALGPILSGIASGVGRTAAEGIFGGNDENSDNQRRAVGAILDAVQRIFNDGDNQRRALGPILSGIASGVGRTATEDIFGDNDDSDNQRRAVGAILGGITSRVSRGAVSSFFDGGNDNRRREVINIPKNLLESLAKGSTDAQQRRAEGGVARVTGPDELKSALRRSALNDLD